MLFILPNVLIRKLDVRQTYEDEKRKIYTTDTVNLYLSNEDRNINLNLEEYIMGVVAAEMPASYEMEALKAQAVIARTYTLNKIETKKIYGNENHPNSDICDNINDCQAYINKEDRFSKWNGSEKENNELWDKIEEAVISTQGIIITYENKPIKAFFHSNSGGMTENVELVWNGQPIEYLKSVETLGENNYKQYSSSVEYTLEEFTSIMKGRYPEFEINFNDNNCIEIIDRSKSNRVLNIKIGNIEMTGVNARTIFSLKSTNFEVLIENGKVIFKVIGYGHGIGMSQTGANELAKNGYNYENIIHHFYTNVQIDKIN